MNANVFIATTGSGLARAERGADGSWSVESQFNGQNVRCLAADPLNPTIIYAGLSHGEIWHSADFGDHWAQLPFSPGSIHRAMIMA